MLFAVVLLVVVVEVQAVLAGLVLHLDVLDRDRVSVLTESRVSARDDLCAHIILLFIWVWVLDARGMEKL